MRQGGGGGGCGRAPAAWLPVRALEAPRERVAAAAERLIVRLESLAGLGQKCLLLSTDSPVSAEDSDEIARCVLPGEREREKCGAGCTAARSPLGPQRPVARCGAAATSDVARPWASAIQKGRWLRVIGLPALRSALLSCTSSGRVRQRATVFPSYDFCR